MLDGLLDCPYSEDADERRRQLTAQLQMHVTRHQYGHARWRSGIGAGISYTAEIKLNDPAMNGCKIRLAAHDEDHLHWVATGTPEQMKLLHHLLQEVGGDLGFCGSTSEEIRFTVVAFSSIGELEKYLDGP